MFCRVQTFPAGAGTNTQSGTITLTQSISACPGQGYTLNAYAGTTTGSCSVALCAAGNCGAVVQVSGSAYTQLSLPFTASASPMTISVQTYCTGKTAGTVYLDSISVI
jgi:hypothetical protein